jgi:starvation-inducible DNA-binding protein
LGENVNQPKSVRSAFIGTQRGYSDSMPVATSTAFARTDDKDLTMNKFTIPGLTEAKGRQIGGLLQKQLSTYNDLHLTLKHVHWNVLGPNFIGVHEMIDPQVELVRGYADETAERIAALGVAPQGTPGAIIKDRTWDDYSVGRDTVLAHLAALDLVYSGVIEDIRKAIEKLETLDLVSQDMLIGQAAALEKFQWFVRAHLENSGGQLVSKGAGNERQAAERAKAG